jgi:DnaJ-class molecular chaperone
MTGVMLATAAVMSWVAGYAVACWVWPFADCRKCRGAGRRRSPTGRAFRTCRRCKGDGKRLRTGRRVFNYLKILSTEGAR